MPKLSKLQIGLIVGALLFFLVLPITLCVILYSQLSSQNKKAAANSYNDIPQVSWGKLLSRSFDQQHGKRLLQAQAFWTRGRSHVEQQKFQEARQEFQSAVTIYEDELGPTDIMVSTVLSMAADNEMKAEQPEAAVKLYQKIIDNHKKQGFNRFLKSTMCQLADAKKEAEDFDGALKVLRECLALQEKALGKESEELIDTINLIGKCLEDEDKPKEAEASYKKALEVAFKCKSNLWIRDCRSNLGEYYQSQAQYEKSNREFEEVLKYANKRDDWLRFAWSEMSTNYLRLRDSKNLIRTATQALEIDRKNKKKSKSSTAIVYDLFCLATAYLEENDLRRFEEYFELLKQELRENTTFDFELNQELRSEVRIWAIDQKLNQAASLCLELLEQNKKDKLHSFFYANSNDKRAYAQLLAASGHIEESEKFLRKEAELCQREPREKTKKDASLGDTSIEGNDTTASAKAKDDARTTKAKTKLLPEKIDDNVFEAEEPLKRVRMEYREYMTDLIALAIIQRDIKKALSLYKETKDAGEDISTRVSAPYCSFIKENLILPKDAKLKNAKIELKTGAAKSLGTAEFGRNKSSRIIRAFLQ